MEKALLILILIHLFYLCQRLPLSILIFTHLSSPGSPFPRQVETPKPEEKGPVLEGLALDLHKALQERAPYIQSSDDDDDDDEYTDDDEWDD